MKRITTHHDGHGRQERLLVLATDEPATEPPGNSSHHRYEFLLVAEPIDDATALRFYADDSKVLQVGSIQFQRGPFGVEGSTPGALSAGVLAALIDHMEGFASGPLANLETTLCVSHLRSALALIRYRADERARRGVLGTMAK